MDYNRERETIAAITIQRTYRNYLQKCFTEEVERILYEDYLEQMATVIQRTYRNYLRNRTQVQQLPERVQGERISRVPTDNPMDDMLEHFVNLDL
jgi:hypothetical protein